MMVIELDAASVKLVLTVLLLVATAGCRVVPAPMTRLLASVKLEIGEVSVMVEDAKVVSEARDDTATVETPPAAATQTHTATQR